MSFWRVSGARRQQHPRLSCLCQLPIDITRTWGRTQQEAERERQKGAKKKMDRGGGEGLIKKENEGVECQREAEPINVS